MSEENNVIHIGERTFEIGPPDALSIVRLAQVIGRVGLRAEEQAKRLGFALFEQVQAQADTQTAPAKGNSNLVASIMAFLAVLTDDDFLEFTAALLQAENPRKLARALKGEKIPLSAVVSAIKLNLEQSDDIVEAIENFTGVIRVARVVQQAPPAGQPPVETG